MAILLVMESHLAGSIYVLPLLGSGRFPLRFMFGNLGVRIFFVISGFLITTLLLSEREKNGHVSLKKFYVRRALRILPASYAFLSIMCLVSALGVLAIPHGSLISSFLYFRDYYPGGDWYTGHLWSLCVEEQFYLIWPIILVLFGQRRAMIVALCTLPVSDLVRSFHPNGGFETNMDALACGCLLACLWGQLGQTDRWQRFLRSPLFWVVPIAILAANKLIVAGGVWLAVGTGVANVLIAISIERFVRYHRSHAARLLNVRVALIIGTLSYSLYLWQEPFEVLTTARPGHLQTFPINVLLACTCAVLSYALIELPFLRLRDRLRNTHLEAGMPVSA